MGTIGDGAEGRALARSWAPSSPVAQDGLWVRPGHGVYAAERLVARVMAWRVAAWHRRQTQIRLTESPRSPSRKSVWDSRSCTISPSPPTIRETERCYLFSRRLN